MQDISINWLILAMGPEKEKNVHMYFPVIYILNHRNELLKNIKYFLQVEFHDKPL